MSLEDYPREAVLRDARRVLLRPAGDEDLPGLEGLFSALPPEEKKFIRCDDMDPCRPVSGHGAVSPWKHFSLVALTEKGIVGVAVLHSGGFPWTAHLGNIRITVLPEWRRKGLGSILAGELFRSALHGGLEKVIAEVVEDQVEVSLFYNDLGFHTEAHLQGQFLDDRGLKHNVLIMSNDLRQLWKLWVENTQKALSGDQPEAQRPGRIREDSGGMVVGGFLAADRDSGWKSRKGVGKGERKMARKILVPIDLGGQSVIVVENAKSLAKEGDELLLLHVVTEASHAGFHVPHVSTEKAREESMESAALDMQEFTRRHARGVPFILRFGVPYKEILAAAKEEKADLIVIGKREGGGVIGHAFVPQTSKNVFLKAECDVEAVHLPNEMREDEGKKSGD
ncbi:MAG: GNAT family N-acetyltransferase [Proteobacteria bacterium]|nr:GNAT family N-acetyltransferase [Pseudomonadota bacterium]